MGGIYLAWFYSDKGGQPVSEKVYASSERRALILAQAERIKKGLGINLHRLELYRGQK